MKRVLPILLAVCLLAGCGATPAPDSTAESPTQSTAPALTSLYDAGSPVETATGGAVRAYPLGDEQYRGLLPLAEGILAISHDGILTALRGEKGEVFATELTALTPFWQDGDLVCGDAGVFYYAPDARQLVVMDQTLQQTQVIDLPQDILGKPLLTGGNEMFYCTESAIRSMNLQTGVSRMVRQHKSAAQELTGSYLGGTIIGCRLTDLDGSRRVIYLKADTGEVVRTDYEGYTLQTSQDSWFAAYCSPEETQFLFGTPDQEAMELTPVESNLTAVFALGGAVGYTVTEQGLDLSFYDFASGLRTSRTSLPGVAEPQAITSDGIAVWLLCQDVLYRWDLSGTTLSEETLYTSHRYTPENPDAEGLAQVQDRVEQMRQTYGISLYIYEEATDLAGDLAAQPEYRVSVLNHCLDQIEEQLKRFPEGFLEATGQVHFYLVKDLASGENCTLYREGAVCHVVMDSTQPAASFLWGLGFAIDTRVLGNSRDFDTWDDLNPKKFAYTYDYEENAQRENPEQYMDSFINLRSMSFPTEDRSWVFAYSLLPEGEEYFQKEALQKKLIRLCQGIREAYGWDKYEGPLPWEQYLEEPLY